MPEEIQRHALTRDDRPRRTLDGGDDVAGLHIRAVGLLHRDSQIRVHQAERHARAIEARDAAVFAGANDDARARLRRDRRLGGDVARPTEIFQKRGANRRLDEKRGQGLKGGWRLCGKCHAQEPF